MLFVLNVVIFGGLERKLDDAMFFLPHSAKERAKILWRDGAAVGFYTIKRTGEGLMASPGSGGQGSGWGTLSVQELHLESILQQG